LIGSVIIFLVGGASLRCEHWRVPNPAILNAHASRSGEHARGLSRRLTGDAIFQPLNIKVIWQSAIVWYVYQKSEFCHKAHRKLPTLTKQERTGS